MKAAHLDRRDFVAVCATACLGLVAGGCVSMVTHPVPVSAGRVRLSITDFPDLAGPAGAIRIEPVGLEDAVYVLADGAGGFTALSPICTHRGCTVDVRGDRLVCPCHGSTYNRAGQVLRGPAERSLARYQVQRDGEFLVVEVGT